MRDRESERINSLPGSSAGARKDGIGALSLMTEYYTQRWIIHPDANIAKQKLEWHLESLVSSGDLQKDCDERYIVRGQPLNTIENYDENNRRHKYDVFLRWIIIFLTALLLLFQI